ncbi:ring domain-containing protein [Cryptosporidium canis]|nr:ring domain-containing protein [Cryptosporidium canis]
MCSQENSTEPPRSSWLNISSFSQPENELGSDNIITRLISEVSTSIINNPSNQVFIDRLLSNDVSRPNQEQNNPPGATNISFSNGSQTTNPNAAAFMVGLNGELRELPLTEVLTGGSLTNFVESMENAIAVALSTEDPNNRFGSPPASVQVVEQLPRETVSEENISRIKTHGPCVVCQDEYNIGDEVMGLSKDKDVCHHIFHANCLLPWLNRHNSCPVCRFELPTDDEYYESRRRSSAQNPSTAQESTNNTGTPTESQIGVQNNTNTETVSNDVQHTASVSEEPPTTAELRITQVSTHEQQQGQHGEASSSNVTISGFRTINFSNQLGEVTTITSHLPTITSTISTTEISGETSNQDRISTDDIINNFHNATHRRIHQLHHSGIDLTAHDLDSDSISDFTPIDTIRGSNSCRMI